MFNIQALNLFTRVLNDYSGGFCLDTQLTQIICSSYNKWNMNFITKPE